MANAPAFAAHLAPDSVRQLERAAAERFEEGERLKNQHRLLGAAYLFGYSVEMCLAAACFRSAGFSPAQMIGEDARRRRMAQARQLLHPDGNPVMSNAPHPLDGWARYLQWLQWHRRQPQTVDLAAERRLDEAVRKAKLVYKHWRPELRYKTAQVSQKQFDELYPCVRWFIQQLGHL
jgi:hypothetical protein